MSLEYIQTYYGVPAEIGGRIEYTGGAKSRRGTITGTQSAHLLIQLDGRRTSTPFHPTWELRYLAASAKASSGGDHG
jgi:hypothetical protein